MGPSLFDLYTPETSESNCALEVVAAKKVIIQNYGRRLFKKLLCPGTGFTKLQKTTKQLKIKS